MVVDEEVIVSIWPSEGHARRRGLILVVAALLTTSALLAVTILLLGASGTAEGRILASTSILAGCGVLALPAAVLLDAGRHRALSGALLGADAAAAALALCLTWVGDDPPEALAKATVTAAAAAVALAQIAALTARRRRSDPPVTRWLFPASTVLAVVIAATLSALVWSDGGNDAVGRVLASLMVLDVLAVALQPILARARPGGVEARMRVVTASGRSQEVTIEARDLGAAVATAIRRVEAKGGAVSGIEILPSSRASSGERPVTAAPGS
jgi:hypothetical protein